MTETEAMRVAPLGDLALRTDRDILRRLAVAAGLGWSILFVVAGLRFDLQTYGDGSAFSYAIAASDSWAFHWHNIASRIAVYVATVLPAEVYVDLTGDARGGVTLYGLLFFLAPLFGIVATWCADRSPDRTLFTFSCASTACLCPLVFGFPTEVWIAHALFWPTLSLCHYGRPGVGSTVAAFASLLALSFTHEGALIFVLAILATLALRRDRAFLRAAGVLPLVAAVWIAVKVALPPDSYFGPALMVAAWHVFDPSVLKSDIVLLIACALGAYVVIFAAVKYADEAAAAVLAVVLTAGALAIYWTMFDHALHAESRYYLRTALLVVTPLFAVAAVIVAQHTAAVGDAASIVNRAAGFLGRAGVVRAAGGAIVVLALVHAVETAKFVRGWTDYRQAIRALAMSSHSDAELGDARFVSATRVAGKLQRFNWSSTTHFLSVLVAPGFAPERLVVDSATNYFWLPCATARKSFTDAAALPKDARDLIRRYSCLHRR